MNKEEKKCKCKHYAELSEPIPHKVGYCEFRAEPIDESDFGTCEIEDEPQQPRTQGDRIRAMSDEELAVFMNQGACHFCMSKNDCVEWNCLGGILMYLESEVKE